MGRHKWNKERKAKRKAKRIIRCEYQGCRVKLFGNYRFCFKHESIMETRESFSGFVKRCKTPRCKTAIFHKKEHCRVHELIFSKEEPENLTKRY